MNEQTVQLILDSLWPLLQATVTGTIPLTAISFVLGLALALVVALMRLAGEGGVRAARTYISVIRGTPLLLQLFIIYYGLPSLGVSFDPFPAASWRSPSTSEGMPRRSSAPRSSPFPRASGRPRRRSA